MIIKRGKVSFGINRKKDCFEHLRQYIGKKLSIRQKQNVLSVCTKYGRRVLLTSDKTIEKRSVMWYDNNIRYDGEVGPSNDKSF